MSCPQARFMVLKARIQIVQWAAQKREILKKHAQIIYDVSFYFIISELQVWTMSKPCKLSMFRSNKQFLYIFIFSVIWPQHWWLASWRSGKVSCSARRLLRSRGRWAGVAGGCWLLACSLDGYDVKPFTRSLLYVCISHIESIYIYICE